MLGPVQTKIVLKGEKAAIVTGKDGGVREAKRNQNLRDPPVVLGKHGTRLYPWRRTLRGMRQSWSSVRWGRTMLKNKVSALSFLSFRSATWHQQRDVM